jgi:hypothetical protein
MSGIKDSNKGDYGGLIPAGQPDDLLVSPCLSTLEVAIRGVIMNYQFNIELATMYGVDEAIMLHNIIFWLRKNKSNNTNFNDGRTWTYNSAASFEELFPFWNHRKIARILKSLEDNNVLVSGNYNKLKYDRTKWYALIDETLLELPFDKSANGATSSVQPIPDSKPDGKQHISMEREKIFLVKAKSSAEKPGASEQFVRCWTLYGKKGNKPTSLRYWAKLKQKDRDAIEARIPAYTHDRIELKYRMDFQGWINPTNRRWEDALATEMESQSDDARIVKDLEAR